MNYRSLVYFHILLSLSCVAASVANLAAICDLSIVVAFGHNELWRPKAAERVSLTSQMLWPLATTNSGGRTPQNRLLRWLNPATWQHWLQLQSAVVLATAGGRGAAASGPTRIRLTHCSRRGETTTQTLPVWDDDKETMGRKIYNTSIPTEF